MKRTVMETEERSRSDQLIEELKAGPRGSQFRLFGLFGMVLLLSILLAIPRFIGASYEWYFQFLHMVLFACAPLVAWVLANVLPRALGRIRVLISAVVAFATVLTFCTLSGWNDGSFPLIHGLCAMALLFWLPQIVCITLVWFFLFRSTSGPPRPEASEFGDCHRRLRRRPPKPLRERLWYQFLRRQLRLQTLLLLVLGCIVVGWFAVRLQRARGERAQRERAAVIKFFEQTRSSVSLGPGGWARSVSVPGNVQRKPGTLDAALVHVKALRGLESLKINLPEVTDAGLEHLQELTNLRHLNLAGTQVTDAGLEHLKRLTNLRSLNLWGTKVTEEGVKQLQQSLPNCQINQRDPFWSPHGQ